MWPQVMERRLILLHFWVLLSFIILDYSCLNTTTYTYMLVCQMWLQIMECLLTLLYIFYIIDEYSCMSKVLYLDLTFTDCFFLIKITGKPINGLYMLFACIINDMFHNINLWIQSKFTLESNLGLVCDILIMFTAWNIGSIYKAKLKLIELTIYWRLVKICVAKKLLSSRTWNVDPNGLYISTF